MIMYVSLQFSSSVMFFFHWSFTTENKRFYQNWCAISCSLHHCLCCDPLVVGLTYFWSLFMICTIAFQVSAPTMVFLLVGMLHILCISLHFLFYALSYFCCHDLYSQQFHIISCSLCSLIFIGHLPSVCNFPSTPVHCMVLLALAIFCLPHDFISAPALCTVLLPLTIIPSRNKS